MTRTKHIALIILFLPFLVLDAASASPKPLRPVHTCSIVVRDAETGELGAAVQSHCFSVGSNVIWPSPASGLLPEDPELMQQILAVE